MAEHYFRPLKQGLFISINGKDDLSKAKYIRGTKKDPGGWLPSDKFAASDHVQGMHLDANLFPHGKTPVVFEDAVKELLEGKQLTIEWLKEMNSKHRQRFYDGDDDEVTCGFEPLSVEKLVNWMNTFHPGWQEKQRPVDLKDIHWTKGRLETIQKNNKKRKYETMDGVKSWDQMMERYKSPTAMKIKYYLNQKKPPNDENPPSNSSNNPPPGAPPGTRPISQKLSPIQFSDLDELLDEPPTTMQKTSSSSFTKDDPKQKPPQAGIPIVDQPVDAGDAALYTRLKSLEGPPKKKQKTQEQLNEEEERELDELFLSIPKTTLEDISPEDDELTKRMKKLSNDLTLREFYVPGSGQINALTGLPMDKGMAAVEAKLDKVEDLVDKANVVNDLNLKNEKNLVSKENENLESDYKLLKKQFEEISEEILDEKKEKEKAKLLMESELKLYKAEKDQIERQLVSAQKQIEDFKNQAVNNLKPHGGGGAGTKLPDEDAVRLALERQAEEIRKLEAEKWALKEKELDLKIKNKEEALTTLERKNEESAARYQQQAGILQGKLNVMENDLATTKSAGEERIRKLQEEIATKNAQSDQFIIQQTQQMKDTLKKTTDVVTEVDTILNEFINVDLPQEIHKRIVRDMQEQPEKYNPDSQPLIVENILNFFNQDISQKQGIYKIVLERINTNLPIESRQVLHFLSTQGIDPNKLLHDSFIKTWDTYRQIGLRALIVATVSNFFQQNYKQATQNLLQERNMLEGVVKQFEASNVQLKQQLVKIKDKSDEQGAAIFLVDVIFQIFNSPKFSDFMNQNYQLFIHELQRAITYPSSQGYKLITAPGVASHGLALMAHLSGEADLAPKISPDRILNDVGNKLLQALHESLAKVFQNAPPETHRWIQDASFQRQAIGQFLNWNQKLITTVIWNQLSFDVSNIKMQITGQQQEAIKRGLEINYQMEKDKIEQSIVPYRKTFEPFEERVEMDDPAPDVIF